MNQFFMMIVTALLTLFSVSGWAQSISFDNSGSDQVTVVGHGFSSNSRSSFQVNIYINNDFIADINTNSNGSFSYTTPRGKLDNGDEVLVKVLDFKGPGNHFTKRTRFNNGQNPRPNPTPTQRTYSRYEIEQYANQQARTVANRVANTYGKAENWKYNFVLGFFDAVDRVGRVGANSRGYSDGEEKGEIDGLNYGMSYANNVASDLSSKEVDSRFTKAVGTGKIPSNEISYFTPAYNGSAPGAISLPAIDAEIAELQERLYRIINGYAFSDNGFSVILDRDFFRLDALYNNSSRSYRFVDSWFRAEYAYEEWRNNRLGGGYDYNIFRDLDYSDREYFISSFKRIYDNVIDEKFYRVKTEYNGIARNHGYETGREYVLLVNYKAAYEMGYTSSYVPNTKVGFNRTFFGSYEKQFMTTFAYYKSNPVIKLGRTVTLSEENNNGIFELGEKLSITLSEVVNVGGVSGKSLSVTLTGASVTTLSTMETLSVPALSKIGPKQFKDLASIKTDIAVDQTHSLKANIGQAAFDLSFSLSWGQLLSVYGAEQASSQNYNVMQAYILRLIQSEFNTALANQKNVYAQGGTLLQKMVQAVATMPNTQTANFADLKPKLLAMVPAEDPQGKKSGWGNGKEKRENAIKVAFTAEVNKL